MKRQPSRSGDDPHQSAPSIHRDHQLVRLLCWVVGCLLPLPAQAGVHPDATLNTQVGGTANQIEITGGTSIGPNLFHSFETFSVPTNSGAWFQNDTAVSNIITRVTGSQASQIDGLLRTNGTANLFLLNPNGITFGPNSSLQIGGSFFATTANRLRFADGTVFSTTPATPPTLTVSVPIGAQLGTQPGDITVRSRFGLTVPNGQTLRLIGGNLTLEGGQLSAQGGQVDLVSLAATQGWDWTLGSPPSPPPLGQTIALTQGAQVNASNGGHLHLQGQQIRVQDGSAILADVTGSTPGGSIRIHANDRLQVMGSLGSQPSRISATVQSGATAAGGDIRVTARQIDLQSDGVIRTTTQGAGAAGNLDVQAENITIVGRSPALPTGLFTTTLPTATGRGGNITLTVGNQLQVLNGGKIKAETEGIAASGNLTIRANQMLVDGLLTPDSVSFVSTSVRGPTATGQGGNLLIETQGLTVRNGGQIAAGSLGAGNAGNLTVRAKTLDISGSPPMTRYVTGLITSVTSTASGQGGNLAVFADRIRLREGGYIGAGTRGAGNSGNLTVEAADIDISGTSPNEQGVSGFFTNTSDAATGHGGNLRVTSDRIRLSGGGQMSASTSSAGQAGIVRVKANQIDVIGTSPTGRYTSGVYSTVNGQSNFGAGGELQIDVGQLRVLDGGRIGTSTAGNGRAGSLSINADTIEVAGQAKLPNSTRPSTITAAAAPLPRATEPYTASGVAGSVNLEANTVTVRDRATIEVSNRLGNGGAGNLNITAGRINLENQASLTAEVSGGSQGNINLNAETILLRRGSTITTNAKNNATGGNITINTNNLVAVPTENSDITANSENNFGGTITVNARGIFGISARPLLTPESDITAASGRGTRFNGTIQLNTLDFSPAKELEPLPNRLVESGDRIKAACGNPTDNTFVAIGRGGLPDSPEWLGGQPVWRDLRPESEAPPVPSARLPQAIAPPTEIVEAQQWVRDANGQVALVAMPESELPAWQIVCRTRDVAGTATPNPSEVN